MLIGALSAPFFYFNVILSGVIECEILGRARQPGDFGPRIKALENVERQSITQITQAQVKKKNEARAPGVSRSAFRLYKFKLISLMYINASLSRSLNEKNR